MSHLASDVSKQPAQPRPEESQLSSHAAELLGMGVSAGLDCRVLQIVQPNQQSDRLGRGTRVRAVAVGKYRVEPLPVDLLSQPYSLARSPGLARR